MSEDDPRAIKPPQKSPVGTAARNIIEAAAEAIPFAGIATAAGRAAFPPAEDKDRDRWAGEVTGRSGAAATLHQWRVLWRHRQTGRCARPQRTRPRSSPR